MPNQKLADEEFTLPKRRRTLFEHGEDLARMNFYLLIIASLALILSVVLGIAIYSIYSRPPYILSEDEGYVMYRSTTVYRLDERRIKTYLTVVLTKLFNKNPGIYDLSEITPLVSKDIINFYSQDAERSAAQRLRENERTLFQIYELRRYLDPENPKFIVAVVRGNAASFRESKSEIVDPTGLAGGQPLVSTRVTDQVVTYVVYLQQVTPSPLNPWGLWTVSIRIPTADAAEKIWSKSISFYNTLTPDGAVIPKLQRDLMQKQDSAIPQSSGTP